ncbi:outer membrane protein assembly factor BamB family protein [Thermotalea metallivorans]|uniref:Bulb-type lectin domain-containing protein n=1 Tax=Thermotalea metallivorans TaxID=520762 RepID=A0A140LCM3_9FIRM|nr:PQQ-binding-like beta-propeller repeat protein [Thermotalea metallivorans]KXG78298.1 hypothetical protein AN619_02730 [Thermotalea metallivorans]
MAELTQNYNLKKPGQDDFYNIEDDNSNMDKIDEALTPEADPAQVPTGNGPGKLVQWVSWFANRIKAITGKPNWWDAPTKSLQELADEQASHLADNVKHSNYAVATGSANTYAVTLTPAPTAYTEGMCVVVKINIDNTGASTINVNGLGAKSIKKPNGNDVTSGGLKAGSIYTLRYNGTNFILQGEGASGNATASDLLSGKTATTDAGEIVGTMPNRGTVNITPGTTNQTIPQGYHSGSGVVYGSANLTASNIKQGVNIFGVTGMLEPLVGNNIPASRISASEIILDLIVGASGSYSIPMGLDIDNLGNRYYFIKRGSNYDPEYVKQDKASNTVFQINSGYSGVIKVIPNSQNVILHINNNLYRYNGTSYIWNTTPTGGVNDFCFTSDNNVAMVTSSGILRKLNLSNGSIIWSASESPASDKIASGSSGAIATGDGVVSSNGKVRLYNSSGTRIWEVSPFNSTFVKSVSIDDNDNVWVYDGSTAKKLSSLNGSVVATLFNILAGHSLFWINGKLYAVGNSGVGIYNESGVLLAKKTLNLSITPPCSPFINHRKNIIIPYYTSANYNYFYYEFITNVTPQ